MDKGKPKITTTGIRNRSSGKQESAQKNPKPMKGLGCEYRNRLSIASKSPSGDLGVNKKEYDYHLQQDMTFKNPLKQL